MLWHRCFRGVRSQPSTQLEKYFIQTLFEHPWFDPSLAPLVLEHKGEVLGFIGRMARPMMYRNTPIRCAVATQLMVDPDRKLAFAALELVRAVQNGPQDLCFSDGANAQSTRIWQRCGGEASRLLSFEWTRRLRPMQSLALRLGDHPRLSAAARVLHPISGVIDAFSVRLLPRFYHKPRCRLARRLASAAEILPLLQQVSSQSQLHPVYSAQTLSWLLQRAAESKSFGHLRSILVLAEDQTPVGWFIYLVRRGVTAHVLQVGATFGHGGAVLSELFRDAWEQNAAAVAGQISPALLEELSNSYCQFRCSQMGVLVHSRNTELLAAVQRGDGFLSRLEGEWWMRFGIDRKLVW